MNRKAYFRVETVSFLVGLPPAYLYQRYKRFRPTILNTSTRALSAILYPFGPAWPLPQEPWWINEDPKYGKPVPEHDLKTILHFVK